MIPAASIRQTGRPSSRRNSTTRPSGSALGTAAQEFWRQRDRIAVWDHDLLVKLVEHHRPAERRRQSRDQEAMVAPRRHTADRARSVPTQTIGDNPLALVLRVGTVSSVPLASVGSSLETLGKGSE